MSRKRVILSIFLMAFLVVLGFVLPSVWKKQKAEVPSQSKQAENVSDADKESTHSLDYLNFEALDAFFSKGQIETLKSELSSYLISSGKINITSIRFLADDTTYPNAADTCFSFQLSDTTTLPVYHSASTGYFFFGEERTPGAEETRSYERQTDDTLPSVTTEEIEQLPEGGYNDTSKKSESSMQDSSETQVEKEGISGKEEIQP